jgi:predicted nucleotidyltransferase
MRQVATPLRKKIKGFTREIVRIFRPRKVVLFGSHAQGTATADSDVDMLVLMNFRGSPAEQALAIRKAVPRDFPLDLILRRPEDATRRLRQGDSFLRGALTAGEVLYESRDAGMD